MITFASSRVMMALGALALAACGASVVPDDGATRTDASADASIASCHDIEPDRVIAPAAIFSDQPLSFTAISHRSQGCSYTPAILGVLGSAGYAMAACGGCEACPCHDDGYEYSLRATSPPPGDTVLHVGMHEQPLRVIAPDACQGGDSFPMRVEQVEVVGPDASLQQAPSAARIYWAHVTIREQRCCGMPALAARVNAIRPANADVGVTLYECEPDPCDCVGTERSVETWIDLGTLTPGRHGVMVSGAADAVSFDVN